MEPNQVDIQAASGITIGDVRARVLVEHTRIRSVIADVDRLAADVAAGELGKAQALRERAGELYRMLAEHVDHEELVLGPTIERIDAWGPVRLEQLRHDHAGQRLALEQAACDLGVEGQRLGRAVQSMCWELLHDMKREEHDLLHPDLWRESIVVLEIGG